MKAFVARSRAHFRSHISSRRYYFHMTRGRAMPTRRGWGYERNVNSTVGFSRARIRSSLDAAGNARRRRGRDATPRRVTAKSRPSTLVGAESRGRANAVRMSPFIFFLFFFPLSIARLAREPRLRRATIV